MEFSLPGTKEEDTQTGLMLYQKSGKAGYVSTSDQYQEERVTTFAHPIKGRNTSEKG